MPRILLELDGADNVITEYINGTTVIGKVDNDTTEMYYLYDGLGSVIAVTDDLGQVVATYEYDVFGKIRNETGSANNNLKYIGEQYDEETGFIYLRARYYDPSKGRFITKDTFAGFGTNPQSLNRYAYAYNNPINLIDPSGHSPLEGTGGTWLKNLNKTLDVIGLIPGIGEPADGLNAVIYAA